MQMCPRRDLSVCKLIRACAQPSLVLLLHCWPPSPHAWPPASIPAGCSLQMMPSEWKGTQLQATRPRRHVMPLVSDPPGLQVLQDLPTIGTALPVIMDHVPSTGLPDVGDWVKIKVVGVAAVQVSRADGVRLYAHCGQPASCQQAPAHSALSI